MKKTSTPEVETNDYIYSNIAGVATDLFQYLIHSFDFGIEGKRIDSVSIQHSTDGRYRGLVRAWEYYPNGDERGLIAFVSGDTVGEVLGSIEDGLAYGETDWRDDKYYKVKTKQAKNRAKDAKKIPLTKDTQG